VSQSVGELAKSTLGGLRDRRGSRERFVKIRGQRRLKAFPFLSPRMAKSKFPRMQHLSREILCESRRVDFVAKHWVTEMMKMHANLMGPSAV
jgi:hypothetical protein